MRLRMLPTDRDPDKIAARIAENAMTVRLLLVVLGLFHILNGLAMLAAPETWYALVPGVTGTGPANGHFIRDIGMAFVASGAMLALGARAGRAAAALAGAGAAWPALHALIHIWSWLTMGFPSDPPVAISEAAGVAGFAVLGVILAWLRTRGEPA